MDFIVLKEYCRGIYQQYSISTELMNNEARPMTANLKLKTSCRHQLEFQFRCLDDLVAEDHRVRLIWDFVSNMDLSACSDDIISLKGNAGRSSTDPKILLTLWIYTIIDGNSSARRLEELCDNHDVYKWICGGVSVNRTTLAEFRSKNPRKFDELLTTCIAVMVKNDLVSDSDFSQDGTRIKANAGCNTFHREDSLKELETKISQHIDSLRKEEKASLNAYENRKLAKKERIALEKQQRVQDALRNLEEARCAKINTSQTTGNKLTEAELTDVRASTTDPQVRKMKMGDGGFRLAYNVQFATGLDSRVIYGVDVVNTLDPGTAPRLMAIVHDRLQGLKLGKIKTWIADAAYSAKNDIMKVANLFPECFYFAPPKPRKGIDPKKPVKGDCEAIKKWREMIGSDQVKELYKRRCSTAEFSNMQVKNHDLTEFPVRGMSKVKGVAILHAISHNVMRFLDLIKKKLTV